MKITKYFTKYSQSITICLREPHNLGEIIVSRHVELGTDSMEWQSSSINWCACGDKSIEKTKIFAAAMQKACELAAKMDSGTITDEDLSPTTAITLEMPVDAAAKLIAKYAEDPESFCAHFKEFGIIDVKPA
jgi:hypothetical protein